jgi:hypothetical protein
MALPGIQLPSSLPPFLIEAHGAQWMRPFVGVRMGTGHQRLRRVFTRGRQIVSVALFLEREEMAAFNLWHRTTLRSGDRKFSARVKDQGAGMLWYAASFVGMYTADALHLGRWKVTAQLLLTGDGEVETPALGFFTSEAVLPLLGVGTLTVPKRFSSEAYLSLVGSVRFRSDAVLALEVGESPSAGRITEDGEDRITEDGEARETE